MDLRTIREAVEAYKRDASPSDAARLDFFAGLFALQQERADVAASGQEFAQIDGQQAADAYQEPGFPSHSR